VGWRVCCVQRGMASVGSGRRTGHMASARSIASVRLRRHPAATVPDAATQAVEVSAGASVPESAAPFADPGASASESHRQPEPHRQPQPQPHAAISGQLARLRRRSQQVREPDRGQEQDRGDRDCDRRDPELSGGRGANDVSPAGSASRLTTALALQTVADPPGAQRRAAKSSQVPRSASPAGVRRPCGHRPLIGSSEPGWASCSLVGLFSGGCGRHALEEPKENVAA
jgi:hypothetical protein